MVAPIKIVTVTAWLMVGLMLLSAAVLGVLRTQGYQFLSVQSGSMRPAIRPGDAVLIHAAEPVKVGEIVSFRSAANPRIINTHRVVAVHTQQKSLITKGDNASRSEADTPTSSVIGVVRLRVMYFGYLLDFLKHPVGLLLCVYLPTLALVGMEIRELGRYYAVYYPRHYLLYR